MKPCMARLTVPRRLTQIACFGGGTTKYTISITCPNTEPVKRMVYDYIPESLVVAF